MSDHEPNAALRLLRLSCMSLAAACLPALAGCRVDDIIDDFGTSGYARIEGTATRANGSAIGNGVSFSCGTDAPDAFGWSVPTDATGHYSIDIDAPGPVRLSADGTLTCQVSAPGNALPIVSIKRSVRFGATAEARPVTIVDLLAT